MSPKLMEDQGQSELLMSISTPLPLAMNVNNNLECKNICDVKHVDGTYNNFTTKSVPPKIP